MLNAASSALMVLRERLAFIDHLAAFTLEIGIVVVRPAIAVNIAAVALEFSVCEAPIEALTGILDVRNVQQRMKDIFGRKF